MPELRPEVVFASAYAPAEPHRVVFQAKAQSIAAAKEAEWATRQGASLVGLPHRSSIRPKLHFRLLSEWISTSASYTVPFPVPGWPGVRLGRSIFSLSTPLRCLACA
jgi:hypothetical protein